MSSDWLLLPYPIVLNSFIVQTVSRYSGENSASGQCDDAPRVEPAPEFNVVTEHPDPTVIGRLQ